MAEEDIKKQLAEKTAEAASLKEDLSKKAAEVTSLQTQCDELRQKLEQVLKLVGDGKDSDDDDYDDSDDDHDWSNCDNL